MNEKLERAVKLYHAHRFEQALAELRALEAETEATPESDYYVGLALTQLGRHEEALSRYREFIGLRETADAPLQAEVAYVRERIARLAGGAPPR
jgi:tetratricopeptide (TPR) repeat protein